MELNSYLDDFCTDALWDANLTWNTTQPRLTNCLSQVGLTIVPNILFWIFLPFEIIRIRRSRNQRISINLYNSLRFIICALGFLLNGYQVLVELNSTLFYPQNQYLISQFLGEICKLFSFFILFALFIYHRSRGLITSGIVWLYLLVNTFCTSLLAIDTYINSESGIKEYDPIIIINFLINLLLFLFCCFTDNAIEAGLKKDPKLNVDELKIKREQKLDKEIYDDEQTGNKQSPESYQSFPSSIFFSWFTDVVWTGRDGSLTINNLWDLEEDLKINNVLQEFGHTYDKEVEKFKLQNTKGDKKRWFSAIRLLKVMIKRYGIFFLSGSLAKLGHDMFQFLNPMLLEILITYIKDQESRIKWHGLVIVFMMLFVGTMKSIFINLYFERMMKVGVKLKSNVINLIYKKSLRLSSNAKKNRTTGEIVNLISVDANRFLELLWFLNLIWSAPLQIIVCIFLLYQQLGLSVIAGVICIVAVIPINAYLINWQKSIQFRQMKYKDERIKLTNEVLSGIKILKFYAWEDKFMERVGDVRATETSFIKKNYFINLCSNFFFTCTTVLVSLATFSVYVFSSKDNILTPEKAFVSISLFSILSFPINLLPMLFNGLILAGVALKRINTFLNAEEIVEYVTHEFDQDNAVNIEGKAIFSWDLPESNEPHLEEKKNGTKHTGDIYKQNGHAEVNSVSNGSISENGAKKESFFLKDIEFKVKKGSFTCIIGKVGSGKSSLLSALLNEMQLREDKMSKKCKINISEEQLISYGAQLAWIQNDTARGNILFGQEFNETSYNEVVRACALEPDFEMLPGKDLVEIGEKGINLSGGQKQRINLARVCYSSVRPGVDPSKQLVLLDDPLSAVDAHVGKLLVDNVLSSRTGLLKDTTRILVTNQLTVLKTGFVDQVLVMKDGKIVLDLTPEQLIEMEEKGELTEFGIKLKQAESSSDGEDDSQTDGKEKKSIVNEEQFKKLLSTDRKLVETEKLETQEVSLKDYYIYIKNAGIFITLLCVVFYISEHSLTLGANVFLSDWTNTRFNGSQLEDKEAIYEFNKDKLAYYALISAFQCLSSLMGNLFLIIAAIHTSISFHKQLLKGILRSPMSFFDTTPLGRIINRFAKDIDVIDSIIPNTVRTFISCMFRVLAAIFIIAYIIPKISVPLIFILAIYYYIQKLYVVTSRQIKRLDSITKSPIYSHFSETLTGVSTIRSFRANDRFINQSNSAVNLNNKCYWLSIIGYRWLGLRLDFLGNVIIFLTALFVVLDQETLDPGKVGLIVSAAQSMVQLSTWAVRMISELETNVVSVERLNEYSNNKQEDDWVKDYKPPQNWPEKGVIKFHDYSTRYREGTSLVLQNLSFKVESTEKIGVVGRTGAGKSTITLALFRIIEPVQGQIIIDDIDITKIGLHSLRSQLSIIPQDPVLFSGSIRFNLDPFDKYSDEEIWKALESAHLKNFVSSLDSGLQYTIAEGGENLSIGQRQLICLARALLKKSKILVLDEATASVDYGTDELIQKTIRKEFADCTTITIAHRINTILDSSKILVLDKGEKREYETPQSLLDNMSSMFYALAKTSNEI